MRASDCGWTCEVFFPERCPLAGNSSHIVLTSDVERWVHERVLLLRYSAVRLSIRLQPKGGSWLLRVGLD